MHDRPQHLRSIYMEYGKGEGKGEGEGGGGNGEA